MIGSSCTRRNLPSRLHQSTRPTVRQSLHTSWTERASTRRRCSATCSSRSARRRLASGQCLFRRSVQSPKQSCSRCTNLASVRVRSFFHIFLSSHHFSMFFIFVFCFFSSENSYKRLVTKATFVGEGFTRKPPKYERFIRPMALRFKKAHVTHPELNSFVPHFCFAQDS